MHSIYVEKVGTKNEGIMEFQVEVSAADDTKTTHKVFVDDAYFHDLGCDAVTPEKFVRRTFEFLLQREGKEAILPEFNVSVIPNYFPEYTEEVRKICNLEV